MKTPKKVVKKTKEDQGRWVKANEELAQTFYDEQDYSSAIRLMNFCVANTNPSKHFKYKVIICECLFFSQKMEEAKRVMIELDETAVDRSNSPDLLYLKSLMEICISHNLYAAQLLAEGALNHDKNYKKALKLNQTLKYAQKQSYSAKYVIKKMTGK